MVLWMSKSGREGMGVSEWHSPTGKCRGMVKSGREGNGVSDWKVQMDSSTACDTCQVNVRQWLFYVCHAVHSHIPKIRRQNFGLHIEARMKPMCVRMQGRPESVIER